jgi:hypothetical protein
MKLPKISFPPPSGPQTLGERLLTITPVALTVLATLLTGLSASEMTKAQYYRATAAQNQAKAGDQWGFFQAKKLRGAGARNSADLLQATADPAPFDPAAAGAAAQALSAHLTGIAQNPGSPVPNVALAREVDRQLLAALSGAAYPVLADLSAGAWLSPPDVKPLDASIQLALTAIAVGLDETQTTKMVAQVRGPALADALHAAQQQAQDWDSLTAPVNRTVDQLGMALDNYVRLAHEVRDRARAAAVADLDHSPGLQHLLHAGDTFESDVRDLRNSFTAARLRLEAARYDAEARMNQTTAGLYEIMVRQSSFTSERHKSRSQHFFYGALVAQVAVIGSTLAIALRRRSLLWGAASGLGLAAFAFAAYVYLYV